MTVATSDSRTLEGLPDSRRRLQAELREVGHWRRLVAARLDLAVAAAIGLEEPVGRALPCCPAVPDGLRELVGLDGAGADHPSASLERLRTALDDLDTYAVALRALGTRHR